MKNLKNIKATNRKSFEGAVKNGKIPEEFDAFEKDAFEGWKANASNFELLQNLDRKYRSKNNVYWLLSGVSLIIIILGVGIFSLQKDKTRAISQHKERKTYTIEKTDIIPLEKKENETKIQTAKKASIHLKTLQRNFEDQKIAEVKTEENIEINALNPMELEKVEEKIPENIENKTNKAVEMYLNDLLLIDYRKYRSKPVVKTESAVISGTPANLEKNQGENIENYEWKTIEIPYIDYISKSISIFVKGNYKKAAQRFEEIKKSYPDDLNANFYGALSYYNLGEYEKALNLFMECKNHKFTNFEEDATWYITKTWIEMKQIDKAKTLLTQIIQKNGFYAESAKKTLNKLDK